MSSPESTRRFDKTPCAVRRLNHESPVRFGSGPVDDVQVVVDELGKHLWNQFGRILSSDHGGHNLPDDEASSPAVTAAWWPKLRTRWTGKIHRCFERKAIHLVTGPVHGAVVHEDHVDIEIRVRFAEAAQARPPTRRDTPSR